MARGDDYCAETRLTDLIENDLYAKNTWKSQSEPQHTATHCNTLHLTRLYAYHLHHRHLHLHVSTTHCNTLHLTRQYAYHRHHHPPARPRDCNTLQHAATRCNTLHFTRQYARHNHRLHRLLLLAPPALVFFRVRQAPLCVAVCYSATMHFTRQHLEHHHLHLHLFALVLRRAAQRQAPLCVAVCCSVLQCVAVCVAACCSVCCSVL